LGLRQELGLIGAVDAIRQKAYAAVIGGLHGANRHYFCPYCMSWIFTRARGIDQFVNLRPTMLDDASWFEPFIETFTKERLPWASTSAVYSFETFPPVADWAGLMAEYAKQASNSSKASESRSANASRRAISN
jgi:hypothetical protein